MIQKILDLINASEVEFGIPNVDPIELIYWIDILASSANL